MDGVSSFSQDDCVEWDEGIDDSTSFSQDISVGDDEAANATSRDPGAEIDSIMKLLGDVSADDESSRMASTMLRRTASYPPRRSRLFSAKDLQKTKATESKKRKRQSFAKHNDGDGGSDDYDGEGGQLADFDKLAKMLMEDAAKQTLPNSCDDDDDKTPQPKLVTSSKPPSAIQNLQSGPDKPLQTEPDGKQADNQSVQTVPTITPAESIQEALCKQPNQALSTYQYQKNTALDCTRTHFAQSDTFRQVPDTLVRKQQMSADLPYCHSKADPISTQNAHGSKLQQSIKLTDEQRQRIATQRENAIALLRSKARASGKTHPVLLTQDQQRRIQQQREKALERQRLSAKSFSMQPPTATPAPATSFTEQKYPMVTELARTALQRGSAFEYVGRDKPNEHTLLPAAHTQTRGMTTESTAIHPNLTPEQVTRMKIQRQRAQQLRQRALQDKSLPSSQRPEHTQLPLNQVSGYTAQGPIAPIIHPPAAHLMSQPYGCALGLKSQPALTPAQKERMEVQKERARQRREQAKARELREQSMAMIKPQETAARIRPTQAQLERIKAQREKALELRRRSMQRESPRTGWQAQERETKTVSVAATLTQNQSLLLPMELRSRCSSLRPDKDLKQGYSAGTPRQFDLNDEDLAALDEQIAARRKSKGIRISFHTPNVAPS